MPAVKLPDGTMAIVCTRGRRREACSYCKRSADRLCDYETRKETREAFNVDRQTSDGHLVVQGATVNVVTTTCSLPICARCTWRPAGTEQDFCRAHAPIARAALPAGDPA